MFIYYYVALLAILASIDAEEVKIDNFHSYMNESFIDKSDCVFQMTEEGVAKLSGGIHMARDLPEDAEIEVYIYSKVANTFTENYDANYTEYFCVLLTKSFFPKVILEYSNFPDKCIYEAGDYEFKNFEMKWQDIAQLLPPGSSNSRKIVYNIFSKTCGKICGACVEFTVDSNDGKKGKPPAQGDHRRGR